MSIAGLSFRTTNTTPTARVASHTCSTAAWSSKTSVACSITAGDSFGSAVDLAVTVGALVHTRTQSFTFDGATHRFPRVPHHAFKCRTFFAAPSVSYLGVGNNARSMAGNLSVSGLNFGQSDNTPSSRVDSNSCSTAAWVSSSSVQCASSGGSPSVVSTEVTVGSRVSTRYPMFTFDGAGLSFRLHM